MSEDIDKIYKEVDLLKENLRKMRFDNVLGQLTNVASLRAKRKQIARKLTAISLIKKRK